MNECSIVVVDAVVVVVAVKLCVVYHSLSSLLLLE